MTEYYLFYTPLFLNAVKNVTSNEVRVSIKYQENARKYFSFRNFKFLIGDKNCSHQKVH